MFLVLQGFVVAYAYVVLRFTGIMFYVLLVVFGAAIFWVIYALIREVSRRLS
jgi:hypothetical protein